MTHREGSTPLGKVGMPVSELDTPALVVDLDLFEANVTQMAAVCAKGRKDWRPHSKGHKSHAIAKRLIKNGAMGVTCAKLGEAEEMFRGGVTDILIANQIAINPTKLRRLATLRKSGCDIIVTVDTVTQAEAISAAMHAAGTQVRCILEVDIGMGRAGVPPCVPEDLASSGEPAAKKAKADTPAAVTLSLAIDRLPGTEFVGLMGYEGHCLVADEHQDRLVRASVGGLVSTAQRIEQAGPKVRIVSCAGTGSMAVSCFIDGVTEIQAGGGIFSDLFYRLVALRTDLRHALHVITTVTSRPNATRVLTDAGRKTMVHWGDLPSMPRVKLPNAGNATETTEVELSMLCAEHGVFDIPAAQLEALAPVIVGDRLEVVPAYHDLTVCLHDNFYAVRNGVVEEIWGIQGRGRMD